MTARLRHEILAGISTFLTILYLFVVYPQLFASSGIEIGSAFTATVLMTAIGTLFVGVYAKSPLALGPGLGAGAFLIYSLGAGEKIPWPTVLGVVFCSAFLLFLFSLFKLRQKLIYHLPPALKIGTMAGIGLFLICIGLRELNIIARDPDTFWRFLGVGGSAHMVALFSLVLLLILYQQRVAGCYIIAILFGWAVGYYLDLFPLDRIVSWSPPSIFPIAMKVDLAAALSPGMLSSLLALFLIQIFDTSASITTLTKMSDGTEVSHLNRLVMTDGPSSMVSSLLGIGPLSFLIESSAGIKAGGRSGTTAITVAILSLATLFFFPFVSSIPLFATAPVLLVLGGTLAAEIRGLPWKNFADFAPALLTFVTIPLTFSLYAGFAFGFVSYTILKALRGQASQVHPICWILTVFFIYHFFS